jgi:hypothetical protein
MLVIYDRVGNPSLLHLIIMLHSRSLRYKPEGRGFYSRGCHWNFSFTKSFWSHYGSEVDSASNSNEYQNYFLVVKVAGA